MIKKRLGQTTIGIGAVRRLDTARIVKGWQLDFTWVRQLAEQANQLEMARQEKDRRDREDKRTAGVATVPFVEKLHIVISGAAEEFNKHCMFPHLRVSMGKIYKHSKTDASPVAEPDEVAYFGFIRGAYLYGVRGVNGTVEFIQMPCDGPSALNLRLHEIGVTANAVIQADVDFETRKVRWFKDGVSLDGPAIIALCQKFFVDLIERTNVPEDKKETRHSYH